MIFSIKSLDAEEREYCQKTISPKGFFALVGSAIVNRESLSVVRMGDGERKILAADDEQPFAAFESEHDKWNVRLGIDEMPIKLLKHNILAAGNSCTYFAPSVSGISLSAYNLYKYFEPRAHYVDNFFVNDWTGEMVRMLLEASDGVMILHRKPEQIITNFKANYTFRKEVSFIAGIKDSWSDNEAAIAAAIASPAQLILFSAGPGGKIIGPEIAKATNKVVIDVGNTLIVWSERVVT